MKPEWGKKVVCTECGSIFYDMNKTDIVCVKCGYKFKPIATKKATKSDKKTKKPISSNNEEIDTTGYYDSDDDSNSVINGNFIMEED